MTERPVFDKNLDSKTFREFYYLKEELVDFCRKNGLPVSATVISNITKDTEIEADFVCSEKHRAFFREHIGTCFSFNVAFQKWLKNNTGKTYKEALTAYYEILEEKKKGKSKIDKQFEYNTYIRDFFADNQGKSLAEAIKCWKYKKQLQGHNRYERSDLAGLD